MASMRDAIRRLNIIYEACAPEAIASAAAEKDMDDFTRLKKKVNRDVKDLRRGLKEREELILRHGTSSETAEASYHLRVMIKALKIDAERMAEYLGKDERRKGKKRLDEEELGVRREIVALCHQHISECEDLEKRRFLEKAGVDRAELMDGGSGDGEPRRPYGKEAPAETNENRRALFEGGSKMKGGGATKKIAEPDPFVTELRDIDVEEDFKEMNQRNEIIDQDLKDIGTGVMRLKEIAQDMNRELDVQNEQLRDLEKGVDKVLDQVDNINIKLKRMMSGDRFMINCILICVILALVVFISSIFTSK